MNKQTLGYCVKCKTKRELLNAQHVTLKNGKSALKGQCAECETNVQIFTRVKK